MDTLSDRRRFVGLFSRSPTSCAKARACGPGLRLDGSEPDTVLGSARSRAVSPVWTRCRRRVFSRQHHRDQRAGHQGCSLWRIRGKLISARQARWHGYRADRYSDARFVVLSCHQKGDQERWRSERKENRRQPTRHGFGSRSPDCGSETRTQREGRQHHQHGQRHRTVVRDDPGSRRSNCGDHRGLRRGAETGFPLFDRSIPSQRSL